MLAQKVASDRQTRLRQYRRCPRHLAPGGLQVDGAANIPAPLPPRDHGGGGGWFGGQRRIDTARQPQFHRLDRGTRSGDPQIGF